MAVKYGDLLSIQGWDDFPIYQARWMQHQMKKQKSNFKDFYGFLEPPDPEFDEHPDPDAYQLKKVFFFNPMNDPRFSVSHGSSGIKCKNGHLLRVVGPRQKAPRPVIGLCDIWYVQGVDVQCTNKCQTSHFSTISQEFLSLLSPPLRSRLPCRITKAKMVSKEVALLVDSASDPGTSNWGQLAAKIKEGHKNAFMERALQYAAHVDFFKNDNATVSGAFSTTAQKSFREVQPFKPAETIHEQTLRLNYQDRCSPSFFYSSTLQHTHTYMCNNI